MNDEISDADGSALFSQITLDILDMMALTDEVQINKAQIAIDRKMELLRNDYGIAYNEA